MVTCRAPLRTMIAGSLFETSPLHHLHSAEWLCRAADRIDPARVFGPHHCLGRGTSAPDSNFLCGLLQLRQNASVVAQGCADFSSDSTDRNHSFTLDPRRPSPSLRPGLSFRYTQLPPGKPAPKKAR